MHYALWKQSGVFRIQSWREVDTYQNDNGTIAEGCWNHNGRLLEPFHKYFGSIPKRFLNHLERIIPKVFRNYSSGILEPEVFNRFIQNLELSQKDWVTVSWGFRNHPSRTLRPSQKDYGLISKWIRNHPQMILQSSQIDSVTVKEGFKKHPKRIYEPSRKDCIIFS